MNSEKIKKAVGHAAAALVEEGMTVGLGTGSTAYYFIQKLIERVQGGLKIKAVSSSLESLELAKKGKIPLVDINTLSYIDITIDGADEIDSQKRMIKGGGGALLREKIVASMSREMVVIIDESKLCQSLGKKKLPVEVVPFACQATLKKLEKAGFHGSFRQKDKNSYFVTDNGNYIIDLIFPQLLEHPELAHAKIKEIPGVVETGFFFHLAGRVIIGFADGQVAIRP